ncbi:hypothetical protein [Mariprofundus ferrooxydans]|uniref:Uncharacterized protein n=1 Tax=Mariprofundus ferrooxydans PV-1 TaxID=314345 RepID=Q0EXW0_9PROT|nr:hypothetical protein [Mariprofundus ferrooxydans]EAU54092.1 hypothetical protein SPV1_00642 [Mariprofundus ferrooxydans PV-1]KON48895.1 hypothetical protein AL013_00750 [Mariprofundus ferrooxydans]
MRNTAVAWLLPCLMLAVPMAQAEPIDELKQLKMQLQLMQQKIEKLEAAQAKAAAERASEQAAAATQAAATQAAAQALPQMPEPVSNSRSDANAFNPQVSFVLNGGYNASSRNPALFSVPGFALGDSAALADRGLTLNESELNLAANVDNSFYASSTLSLPAGGGINVEEAYVQTLGLPAGLTVKGGRFFSDIGYINHFHPHHDDFIDRSLANRVFLNSIFAGDGLQARWLAPTDTFLELGGELLRGDRFPGGGAARRGTGSWDLFVHAGGDVGFSNSWLAGFSWLNTTSLGRSSFDNTGAVTGTFDGNSTLAIANLVWKWAPNGNPVDRNFKFQMELFGQRQGGAFNTLSYQSRQWGGYVEAVYQPVHGWDIGLRHSLVFAANRGGAVLPGGLFDSAGHRPNRTSLVLGYANSEFSHFRMQFSLDKSQPLTDYQLGLQYIMIIGAHGAHQY